MFSAIVSKLDDEGGKTWRVKFEMLRNVKVFGW